MTLDEIEGLAHWIAPDDIHPQSAGEDDIRLARAVIAMLPVVRAAETAADAQWITSPADRRSYENLVWRAIDTMRAALGGGK